MNKQGVALVTGASRGLGRVMAARLARDGWLVALNFARDVNAAEDVARTIRENGGKVVLAPFDVTQEGEVARSTRALMEAHGPVRVLVNNATGPQPLVPLEQLSWADCLAQLEFFVKAPLLLVQALAPGMRELGGGRVINIGSEVVSLGNAEMSHYVAAKAAMVGLTRSWARELGPYGITVNVVAPGWIPVERHADATHESLAKYAAGVPLGHMGTAEDVASLVAYLASNEAGFVTGQVLPVNGGNTFG